jgi:hypothetical protein
MRLQEHLGITSDFFTYAIAYLNDFPPEDQMSSERAVSDLLRMIREAREICRSEETKHWLALSLEQMVAAQQCVNLADEAGLEKHLKTAFEFFDKARNGKESKTNFVVGADGQAKRVAD